MAKNRSLNYFYLKFFLLSIFFMKICHNYAKKQSYTIDPLVELHIIFYIFLERQRSKLQIFKLKKVYAFKINKEK